MAAAALATTPMARHSFHEPASSLLFHEPPSSLLFDVEGLADAGEASGPLQDQRRQQHPGASIIAAPFLGGTGVGVGGIVADHHHHQDQRQQHHQEQLRLAAAKARVEYFCAPQGEAAAKVRAMSEAGGWKKHWDFGDTSHRTELAVPPPRRGNSAARNNTTPTYTPDPHNHYNHNRHTTRTHNNPTKHHHPPQLAADVRRFKRALLRDAAPGAAVDAVELAARLTEVGYPTVIRTALGAGGADPSADAGGAAAAAAAAATAGPAAAAAAGAAGAGAAAAAAAVAPRGGATVAAFRQLRHVFLCVRAGGADACCCAPALAAAAAGAAVTGGAGGGCGGCGADLDLIVDADFREVRGREAEGRGGERRVGLAGRLRSGRRARVKAGGIPPPAQHTRTLMHTTTMHHDPLLNDSTSSSRSRRRPTPSCSRASLGSLSAPPRACCRWCAASPPRWRRRSRRAG